VIESSALFKFRASAERNVRSVLHLMRLGEAPATPEPASGAFLEWRAIDQLGNPKIDEQHRALVNLINRFHTVLVIQRDRSTANEIFSHFIHSVRNHFNYEESVLIDQRCPGYQAHFDQHSDAIAEVQDLYRQFKGGTLSASVLLVCLRNWMIDHTRTSDRRYAGWMNTHSVGRG